MGATLEQFDLTQEDYGGPAGQVPRGAGPQPPGRDRGRARVDARRRRRGARDRHLPGQPPEARGVGSRRPHARDQPARPPRSPARPRARRASWRARSAPPATCPPPTTPRSARSPSASWSTSSPSRPRGLVEGGADLIIIETAQDILEVKAAIFGAREAFKHTGRTLPIQIERLAAAQRRQDAARHRHPGGAHHAHRARRGGDRAQLLDRPRGHARRDPLPRRDSARCRCTASPTPACRSRAPTARRSSPRSPSPLASTLQEFVERYGVGIVGGCCGTTPDHIAAIVDKVGGREAGARPEPGEALVSRMMTAAPLVQEPRPTLVGERVNSQGSRKAKELLLADDYDGLVTVAEDQVDGRRPRARRLRRAHRAPGRGRADARGGQARVADPARADPGRLHRARGDPGRRSSRSPAARSSTPSTSRPAATRPTRSSRSPRPTAPR